MYREIVKNFFNRKNITLCKQEELIQVDYEKLLKFYQETINLKNLTLINHGDMSPEQVLSTWNQLCEEQKKIEKGEKQIPIVKNQSATSTKNDEDQPNASST